MHYTKMKLPRTMEINLSLIIFLLPPHNLSHCGSEANCFDSLVYDDRVPCLQLGPEKALLVVVFCHRLPFRSGATPLPCCTCTGPTLRLQYCSTAALKKSNCSVMGVTELLRQIVVDLVMSFEAQWKNKSQELLNGSACSFL